MDKLATRTSTATDSNNSDLHTNSFNCKKLLHTSATKATATAATTSTTTTAKITPAKSTTIKATTVTKAAATPVKKQRNKLIRATESIGRNDAIYGDNANQKQSTKVPASDVMGGGFAAPPSKQMHEKLQQQEIEQQISKIGNTESSNSGSVKEDRAASKQDSKLELKEASEKSKLIAASFKDKAKEVNLKEKEKAKELEKSKKEKQQKPHKESKFAAKLRRSFRRNTEQKSFEINRPDKVDATALLQETHSLQETRTTASKTLQREASGERSSIFSLSNLPGLGGHINPALLLDSPEEATPPEFNYRHLSSVATTNSSTSVESSDLGNDFCSNSATANTNNNAPQQSNSSMGGEVSTNSSASKTQSSAAATTGVSVARQRPKLQKQSSSKSDGGFVSLTPTTTTPTATTTSTSTHTTASRSCSLTSESSSARLTRLQNFLFKSSGESSRSYLGHSNDGFTASSHNSSSGEWENLAASGSYSESLAPSCAATGTVTSSTSGHDSNAGSYYQYTLTSPNNPFLPEIIARTYRSTYDEEEEDAQHAIEMEELDANVTSVKYVGQFYGSSVQQITPASSSRTNSQEGQDGSAASSPGRQKRKLFQLNSPQTHYQQLQQMTSATCTTTTAPTTTQCTSRCLNPFLCSTKSAPPATQGSSSYVTQEVASSPQGGSNAFGKRLPLKQVAAITSPIAVPPDLNAKREEFLRATMKICLVVSPPSSKLQLKSKSLTHLDGLDSMVACHQGPATKPIVSSSEYFSVSFCTENGYQEEEFIPATKGVTLANALSQALRRRNLSFSQITVTDNNVHTYLEAGNVSNASSLDENTEVENLAGRHLIITDRDGSRKTLQKAASFGSRTRPPRLLSSASTEETTESADQRIVPGKQLKQRWSGLFGIKNPQQTQLCELLNSYAKSGVPQKTAALNFDHPDFDAAQEYLDNMHKSWRDFVHCEEMSDNETRIQTAIWELVTTEVYYIHALQTVTDLFLACLEAVQEEKLLTDVDQHRLFSNVRDICEANLKFWTLHLYPMVAHSVATHEPLRIEFFQAGFNTFASTFAPYKKYCAEQSTCQFYCKELNRTNALFTSYLAWCESQKMCNRLRLADILVRPMQRLTKYSLLLMAIKKHMLNTEEIEAIDAMVHTVENFVCSVNNHLTTRQENERLKGVMARIESYDVVDTNNELLDKMVKQYSQMFDLCAPMKGCASHQVRHLFMEGDHKFKDHLGKADVHCFLLTDMLLVCKTIAKKGLGTLKIIRQPYLTDRLVVHHNTNNNILNCVYLNEFQVVVTAFTLQCSEAKNWYESLKRTKMIYTRLKQGGNNWDGCRFGTSTVAGSGAGDSLGVKKSPLNSSICSHVTSANNSHSGSVEWNDSRNISVDFEKTNSLSSDEGSSLMGTSHAYPLKMKAMATSPHKLNVIASSANTLSVQPLNLLGQSLPNLNLHHNPTNLYHTYSNNTLLVPGTTSSHSGNVLLSPCHRGISYPPPSPTRVPLRRGMAFSASIKNPPLVKTRNITSQNSINWHQTPATPTPTSPQTSQHNSPCQSLVKLSNNSSASGASGASGDIPDEISPIAAPATKPPNNDTPTATTMHPSNETDV